MECRHFMDLGDWDAARRVLQQIAYTMPGQPQEEKNRFTRLMTEFASRDPLVGGVARLVLPTVRAQPGVMQTDLYKHAPGVGVEEVRYALYFLEQLGAIRRKKKGRSYQVFEAHPVVEATEVKPL